MSTFKDYLPKIFIEKPGVASTESGYIFRYTLLGEKSQQSGAKQVVFFLSDDTVLYDREQIYHQMIEYHRILKVAEHDVVYRIVPIGNDPIIAQEIIAATLVKNSFDLVVSVNEYPTDMLSSVCWIWGLNPRINFINVENPILTRMVSPSGKPLENRTGVVRIQPSHNRLISFLTHYKTDIRNILVLRDSHYRSVPVDNGESLPEGFGRSGYNVQIHEIDGKMDLIAQLFKIISDFQAVIIDHNATAARPEIAQLVHLCSMNSIPRISGDATGVYMGAAIGIGHNGYPYGKLAVIPGVNLLLSKEKSVITPYREICDDQNICFNDSTRRNQGIQVKIHTDAALYAQSIIKKYRHER